MSQDTPLQALIRRKKEELKIPSWRRLSIDSGLEESVVKKIMSGKNNNPSLVVVAGLVRSLKLTADDLSSVGLTQPSHSIGSNLNDNFPVEGLSPRQSEDTESVVVHEVAFISAQGRTTMAERQHIVAQWLIPKDHIVYDLRIEPSNLRIMTVEADNMISTILPGDKVWVDVSKQTPAPPGVFMIWDGLAPRPMRLEHIDGSDPIMIRCISDNERYAPRERLAEQISIYGRIVGRYQRL